MKAFSLFFRPPHLDPLIPFYTGAGMILKHQAGHAPHAYTFQGTDHESPLLPTPTKLLPAAPAVSQAPALSFLHFCATLLCLCPSAWLSDSSVVFLCWERSPFPSSAPSYQSLGSQGLSLASESQFFTLSFALKTCPAQWEEKPRQGCHVPRWYLAQFVIKYAFMSCFLSICLPQKGKEWSYFILWDKASNSCWIISKFLFLK